MQAGMAEDDRLFMLADLVTNGRFEDQFTAGFEAEIDRVVDRARHPVFFGNPGHRRETHAGDVLDHAQDDRHRINAADGFNV